MKKLGLFACLVAMALAGMVGYMLTIHAGEVNATNKGDLLFYNRYFTTSKTPISDLDKLIGSSATGTSGQIRINDGTDFESKTVSGLFTLASTGVATGTLADAKVWIGNSAGEAVAVTPSGAWTITNGGVSTLGANAVSAASMIAANVVDSSEINDNAVGLAQFNVNTVNVEVAASGTSGTATVTAGSGILGFYPIANVHDGNINGVANISIASTTLTLAINGTAGSNIVRYKVVVLEP